mmetsp:Transcript_14394/g.62445  ORF Transcript_14394/g.62445 Transcript_14394/m.62445 type:complete len:123 (-) Transcript_14394:930-1298(-)
MLVRWGRRRAHFFPRPSLEHEAKCFSGLRVFKKYVYMVVFLSCLLSSTGATAVVVVFICIAFVWIDGDHLIAVCIGIIVIVDVLFRPSYLFEFTARNISYGNNTLLVAHKSVSCRGTRQVSG